MLTIICGKNHEKTTIRVSGNTIIMPNGEQNTMPTPVTIRNVINASGLDFEGRMINLNGDTIRPENFDRSFESLGITDGRSILSSVAKPDNA